MLRLLNVVIGQAADLGGRSVAGLTESLDQLGSRLADPLLNGLCFLLDLICAGESRETGKNAS